VHLALVPVVDTEGSLVLVAGSTMLLVVRVVHDPVVVEGNQNQPVVVAANKGLKEVAAVEVEM
jgi:hypothetical protein